MIELVSALKRASRGEVLRDVPLAPRTSVRVVCTLWETIVTLAPTSALISVDFPTLGVPIKAMKPHRLFSCGERIGGKATGMG